MSVPEERYANQTNTVCVTEDDYNSSSYGDEDYSADSELELGDLNCTDDDLSHSSLEFNQGSLSGSPTASGRRNTNLNTWDIPDHALRQHVVLNTNIVDEGLRLYMMFLQQEIIGSRLEPPGFISRQNREMPRHIGSLRALADQFSTSAQRQWIREQAQVVPLQSLDFCSFIELLGGLFHVCFECNCRLVFYINSLKYSVFVIRIENLSKFLFTDTREFFYIHLRLTISISESVRVTIYVKWDFLCTFVGASWRYFLLF